MKHFLTTTALLTLIASPALAGDATAIGIGTGIAASRSNAASTAIGGGNATGGSATITSNPTAAIISTVPANTTQTITTQGHSSVSTVPSVFAPGLAAAGIESCLGSVSGGGSFLGTGITLGGSIPDGDCSTRLDARTLWAFGLKKAAVARLCLSRPIYESMPEVCVNYLPHQPVAAVPVASTLPGQIWLVEGSTGHDRLCNRYDAQHQKCRAWANASPTKRVKTAAMSPQMAETLAEFSAMKEGKH